MCPRDRLFLGTPWSLWGDSPNTMVVLRTLGEPFKGVDRGYRGAASLICSRCAPQRQSRHLAEDRGAKRSSMGIRHGPQVHWK